MRYFICFLLILTLLAGCNRQTGDHAAPPPNFADRITTRQVGTPELPTPVPFTLSEYLEAVAMSNPQVRHATCVVMGNTAVIGIDVDAKLDRSRVGTIKYSVAQTLRKDPYGKNAIVTADMDLYQRLREIRQETMRGRPLSGFAEEMADIIGRIVPQFPKHALPQTHPTR